MKYVFYLFVFCFITEALSNYALAQKTSQIQLLNQVKTNNLVPQTKYYNRETNVSEFAGCQLPPPRPDYFLLRCRAMLPDELQCVYEHQIESYWYEIAIFKSYNQCEDPYAWNIVGMRLKSDKR